MRGPYLVSLTLLLPLGAACAQGETGGFGGSGESSTASTTSGGGSSTASSGTASSTTGASSGGVPSTCMEAHGSVGCCDGDTAYYCKTGQTSLTVTNCASPKVCGWNSSSNYYSCVTAPGGADPSNSYPESCN